MLIISNISKRYGPKILFKQISLRVARGERMGLVGANGAGKTTLFSILLGKNQEDEDLSNGKEISVLVTFLRVPLLERKRLWTATAISDNLEKVIQTLRTSTDDSPERAHALERFANWMVITWSKGKKILAPLAFQSDFDKPAKPSAVAGLCELSCPLIGDGSGSPDARWAHQSLRSRNFKLVPIPVTKIFGIIDYHLSWPNSSMVYAQAS